MSPPLLFLWYGQWSFPIYKVFIFYDMSLSLILIKVKSFLECCIKSGFVTYTSLFLECEMSSYFEINKATNINFAFFCHLTGYRYYDHWSTLIRAWSAKKHILSILSYITYMYLIFWIWKTVVKLITTYLNTIPHHKANAF